MSGKINVLLISYHFSPCNTIGAIRPTKITKYLSKDIYNIDVICASPSCKDRSNVLQISDNIKVYYVGDSKKMMNIQATTWGLLTIVLKPLLLYYSRLFLIH